ncbi:MAG: hypothetical protein C0611_12345 [Desulfobacteraceae bacterium]|nr:MAG: hypothetical protein C0611_12345 [Desulfobacteraceae bacterium]
MMEYWNNGFWDNAILGLMVKFVLRIKLKMDKILLKTNLPLFHHSIIPYLRQAFKTQKMFYIFIKL